MTLDPMFTHHDPQQALSLLDRLVEIYAEAYAEPPYHETAADVQDFQEGFAARTRQPGFDLVTAHHGPEIIGYVFGHNLAADTRWWDGLLDPVPAGLTDETGRRTVAVIELAVRAPWRRQGVAGGLIGMFLAPREEERATLLVRPDAPAPVAAYAKWGWSRVGRLQPWPGAPIYDAMLIPLPVRTDP
jgi:GNAT superfamily N-acetyltransferase